MIQMRTLLPIALIAILALGLGTATYGTKTTVAQAQSVMRFQGTVGIGMTNTELAQGITLGMDTYQFSGSGPLKMVIVYGFAGGQASNGISSIATGQALPAVIFVNDASTATLLTTVFAGLVTITGPPTVVSITGSVPGTVSVNGPGGSVLASATYISVGGKVPALNEQVNLPSGYTVVIHADQGTQAAVSVTASPLGTGSGEGDIATFSLKIVGPKP